MVVIFAGGSSDGAKGQIAFDVVGHAWLHERMISTYHIGLLRVPIHTYLC